MSVNALSLHDVYNVDSTTLVSYDTRLYMSVAIVPCAVNKMHRLS